MNKGKNLPLIIICYISIYLIWGSTYYFIAKAVETIPASWIVGVRFSIAGTVMILIPILSRKVIHRPTKKEVGTSIFLGFFLLIMGNGVVTVAEKWVDSYIASLIISTVPLVVAIMDSIIYKTRMNYKQITGFFIGFTGVAFLLYSNDPKETGELKGLLLLFLAITCWGFGTAWSKKMKHHSNTLFSTGMQMLFAGFISLIVIIYQGESPVEMLRNSSSISIFSVIFLTVIGGVAIAAYNYLLKHEPTGRITSYALVNPLIATIIGTLIAGEQPAEFLLPGILLILTGLIFMLYLSRNKKST